MMQHLQNNITYLDVVAKVVCHGNITTVIADVTSSQVENRISQYCLVVKKVTAMHVLTEYSLKASCGNKAKELLEGHTYIFPVKNGKVRCPCCARRDQTLNSERPNAPSCTATPYSQQSSGIPSDHHG
jgi:hypothetical protein